MASMAQVTIKNLKELKKDFDKLEKKAEKVVERTTGEFKSRGPAWISKEVAKEYNIKKSEVNEAKVGSRVKGKVKVKGINISNIELIYKGKLLTPVHFSMTPKLRPDKKKYTVSVKIKKSGGKKKLGSRVFLASSGRVGSTHIPFQRRGSARLPIDVIKTVSVPQMITNEKVSAGIYKAINENLGKRLEHNMKRMLK